MFSRFTCCFVLLLSLLTVSFVEAKTGSYYTNRIRTQIQTGATRTMDVSTSNVFEGMTYTAHRESLIVLPTTSLYMELQAPDSFTIGLEQLSIGASGTPWTITILEAPTYTTGTAILRADNKNRTYNTDTLSGAVLKKNPTYTSGGTSIFQMYVGGSNSDNDSTLQSKMYTNVSFPLDLLLKKSTNYLIRLQNTTGDTNSVSAKIDWYQLR